jgi:hypothetical protein
MRSEFSQTQCEYFWNGPVFVSLCNEVQEETPFSYLSALSSGLLIGGMAYVALNSRRNVQLMTLIDGGARKIGSLYRKFFEKTLPLQTKACQQIIKDYFETGFLKFSALEHLLIQSLLPKEAKLVSDFHQIFQGRVDGSEAVQREVAEAILKILKVKEEQLLNSSRGWDFEEIEKMMESLGLEEAFSVLREAHPNKNELVSFGPWSLYMRALNLINEKRAQIQLDKYKEVNRNLLHQIRSFIPREKREIIELLFKGVLEIKFEGAHDYELVGPQEDFASEIERISLERSKIDGLLKIYSCIDTPLNKIEELDPHNYLRSLFAQIRDSSRAKEIFSSIGLGQIFMTSLAEDPDLLNSDKSLVDLILGLQTKGAQICGW